MASAERAPMFDADDLDLSEFQSAVPAAKPRQDRTATKQLAAKVGFTPREPEAVATASGRLGQRRHTTGRNYQLNLKVREADARRFMALADAKGWVLGEAFAHALDALEAKAEQAG